MARGARLATAMLAAALGCASAPVAPPPSPPPPAPVSAPPRPPGTAAIELGESAPGGAPPTTEPPPAPPDGSIRAAPSTPPAGETWGGLGMKEVSEKDWLAGVRQAVAARWKVDPAALILSPGKLHVAFVRGPAAPATPPKKPPRHPPPRRFQIFVVDNQGKKVAAFRPVTARGSDEPPKDLKFLSEEKLIYEVVAPPAPPPAAAVAENPAPPKPEVAGKKRPAGGKAGPPTARRVSGKAARSAGREAPAVPAAAAPVAEKPALPPPRLFIIQPLPPRARVIRCEGHHFTFTAQNDRVAYVGGTPEAAFVAVDGTPVYPRQGRSVIPSPVAWSKDGRSLAFLETPPGAVARLVLLGEYDNPTGDTTWNLPAATPVDGTRVFWAGAGKLVVGKTITHPLFSASFEKQLPTR